MARLLINLSCLFFLIACASCNSIKPDEALAAVDAGDFTALVEGCGNQLVSGYTYCRMTEGEAANKKLWVVGPNTSCDRDACVYYKFLDNRGEVVHGGSIPKGKERAPVLWADILGNPTFEINHNGFWGLIIEVFWNDKEGERKSVAHGEIRMRVHRASLNGKSYKPLANVKDDANFVWEYDKDGVTVKMTTGMRTYVSKKRPQ